MDRFILIVLSLVVFDLLHQEPFTAVHLILTIMNGLAALVVFVICLTRSRGGDDEETSDD